MEGALREHAPLVREAVEFADDLPALLEQLRTGAIEVIDSIAGPGSGEEIIDSLTAGADDALPEVGSILSVPLTVLATAAATCDREWIDLLVTHPAFEPVTTDWSGWASLAAAVGLTGGLDKAEALVTALHLEAEILTADPTAYQGLGDDPPLIIV